MKALLRLVSTIAIVSAVAILSRTAPSGTGSSAESVRCELDPPADIAGLEACLARSPRDVQLLVDLGVAYLKAGQTDEARASYQRALDVDPRDGDLQRRLNVLQDQLGSQR